MSILADHITKVKASEVSLVSARALELERQGRDIIRLSAGEPDFPTPDHIKIACIKALCDNKTKYPPVIGLPELREAVCLKLKRDNALDYSPEQVIVCTGCKQVLFNAMTATLNPGDEVILTAPYWMTYAGIVELSRAVPVFLPTRLQDGFKPSAEALEKAITPRTKWLFLNSPGNPSGAVFSAGELEAFAGVLRRHPQVWILSDDIYEFLVYDGIRFVSLLNVAPDLKDRFLVVNGLSKAYCMPGWRLGYGVGPAELIKAMFKVQSQSTSGATHFCQWAAVTALTGDHSFIASHNAEYAQRRDLVVAMANRIPGLNCRPPQGAFYCFIGCGDYVGRKAPGGAVISSDEDLVGYLLTAAGVAMVPGTPFGMAPYIRVSFATARPEIEKAFERIREALGLLR
ncbi:MAG: Aspartate aminotransferase [Syntrophaceae bacterium PtaU1.Bin231]|nr:MAG: Aspartate aminotransferase [Syntrophaceae bacterium PtaU1.Bin231]